MSEEILNRSKLNNHIKDILIDLCQDKMELIDAYKAIVTSIVRHQPKPVKALSETDKNTIHDELGDIFNKYQEVVDGWGGCIVPKENIDKLFLDTLDYVYNKSARAIKLAMEGK